MQKRNNRKLKHLNKVQKLFRELLICTTVIFTIAIYSHADPADDLHKRAFEAFTQNNADEALRLCQKILTDYPDSKRCADAQWGIASVYSAILHDYEKAYLARKQLVEKYPDSKWADDAMSSMVLYWHGKAREERRKLDKDPKRDLSKLKELCKTTIDLSREFLKRYPKSTSAFGVRFYGMAEVYRYFLKDCDKAIEVAKEIISQYPAHRETSGKYIFIGSIYEEQMNQIDLSPQQRLDLARFAEKWYKDLLEKHPYSSECLNALLHLDNVYRHLVYKKLLQEQNNPIQQIVANFLGKYPDHKKAKKIQIFLQEIQSR